MRNIYTAYLYGRSLALALFNVHGVYEFRRHFSAFMNPRRACAARVTVVVLSVSVCLSVCLSVPALAASASVGTSKQRYLRVSLRLFLD